MSKDSHDAFLVSADGIRLELIDDFDLVRSETSKSAARNVRREAASVAEQWHPRIPGIGILNHTRYPPCCGEQGIVHGSSYVRAESFCCFVRTAK